MIPQHSWDTTKSSFLTLCRVPLSQLNSGLSLAAMHGHGLFSAAYSSESHFCGSLGQIVTVVPFDPSV
jgi:hypothetical protein